MKTKIENRERSQRVIISNDIPIVGASVPLRQAQDHNMLCRSVIKTNVFISIIKTVHWIEENLLLPPLRGWPQPYIEDD